jgi:hypothetical protein
MQSLISYIILINFLLVAICVTIFFLPDGININLNTFQINISSFGTFVIYSILSLMVVFVNVWGWIYLKYNYKKMLEELRSPIRRPSINRSRRLEEVNTRFNTDADASYTKL